MRITELLDINSIALGCTARDKESVIKKGVECMMAGGHLNDEVAFWEDVWKREESCSTGIGGGIGLPHGKSKAVKTPGLSVLTLPEGADFDTLDGEPVKLVFMIAVPEESTDLHLEIISRLSVLLVDPVFQQSLLEAASPEEFLKRIDAAEEKKFGSEGERDKKQEHACSILAVTACPTGIAHTYMAQEALEKEAERLGYTIKVETNGSCGVKNQLTPEDIAGADCIIVAADRQVEMERFDGKRVIMAKVSEGISDPNGLIRRGLDPEAPIYHAETNREEKQEKKGWVLYKHLMNGVSYMLPFVIGGGILIAIAFLLDDYEINPENFGMNTPAAAFLKTIGDNAFKFMLPVFSGFIAMSIADRPGLAVGFVGGALAESGCTFASIMDAENALPVSSGFIGALAAGFLSGYIVRLLVRIFRRLPESLEGIRPVLIYPVAGILLTGTIMVWINPLIGSLNVWMNQLLTSMSGSGKALLGMVLGAMMAVDMGGPFNKAAYLFGTASLANSGFEIMAAVMAGGMVPPLAIAICATFFKSRFTDKERKMALINYVMGLSFITEGAIPFAAADPLRVIPSCVIGSAAAAALSMIFSCGLRAPHGGVFVIPTVIHPFQYILAIGIGAVLGGIVMGVLKKKHV